MGTKLQSNPYLPGYYSMRDLNEDANASRWSLFCDDKTLTNKHYYNGFAPSPVDGYSDHDKEVLKQTMLKHEATFRKQVYELHRLYRIQRDLMDELQKKELYGYSMSTEASQSNPFSSRIPSEYTPSTWQTPSLVNSSYCGPSISVTESRRSPLHFLKESSLQAGASRSQNGVSVKDFELLDSKCRVPRKAFDLQLPADEYIETEDGKGADMEKVDEMSLRSSYSRNVNRLIESESGVGLSFGASENPNCGETARRLDSHGVNVCRSHCLADLNEPIQGMSDGNAEVSSSNFLGQMVFQKVVQGHKMPMEPNAGIPVPQRSFFLDIQKDRDQKTDLNTLHPDIEEKRGENISENLSYFHGLGRNNASFCKPFHFLNKLPISAEPLQAEAKKVELPQFVFSNQNKKETSSREKAAYGRDSANPGVISSNYSVQGAPVPGLLSANLDEINSSSPARWRNSRNNATDNPIAIQALPGCNEPAVLNLQNKSSKLSTQSSSVAEKWDLHGCSRLSQSMLLYKKSETNPSSLQCVGFEKPKDCSPYEQNDVHEPGKFLKGFNCTDVKSAKDMHLNVYRPNELQGEDKRSQDTAMSNGRERENGVPSGIPWLRRKPACNEPASSTGSSAPLDLGLSACSQPPCLPDTRKWLFGSGTGNLKDISLGFIPELASTLHSNDTVSQKIQINDSASGAKIPGFPLLKNSNISKGYPIFGSLSMHCQDNFKVPDGENDVKIHLDDFPCDHLSSEMKKKLDFVRNPASWKGAAESSPSGERCCINLNVTVASWDELSQPSLFSEADAENLTSLPRAVVENTTGIDLEAPISRQEDNTHLEAEALTSQLETPAQVLQCEREDSQANLAKVAAAETIVEISAALCNNSSMANRSSSSLTESILWFSEVVSANACDLENLVRVSRGKAEGNDESLDSGNDSFEALILKLTETKLEVESCNKPWQHENQKYEMMGPSPWLSRPRKRHGRRGRRRKDFQRDILPGLVTLSRHEVTEDLQMIGGLMRASDCSWQIGVVRKNTARNGWHCQARGRRQPRVSAAAVAVSMVNPPQRQPVTSEVELEEINLRGWGKTTRRCRRQRFRTADFSAHLT